VLGNEDFDKRHCAWSTPFRWANQGFLKRDSVEAFFNDFFFFAVFLLLVGLTRTLSSTDLENLKQMASGLGPLKKIVNLVLALLEKFTPKTKLAPK